LGKKWKIRLSVMSSASELPFASDSWELRPQTPALLLPPTITTVKFVSTVKRILFRSIKNQVTTANVLPLLLPHFFTYFLIQTLSFVEEGRENISCPWAQGTLATPLAFRVRIGLKNCLYERSISRKDLLH